MNNDLYCNTDNILDGSFYQNITSYFIDPTTVNTDIIRDFICKVAALPDDENIDPIISSAEPADYQALILNNFAALTGVGDPRISLGDLLRKGFTEFLPIMVTKTELIRSGGCQIIENYVCDQYGDKIKKLEFYCPPNINQIVFTPEYIIRRTNEIINEAKDNHARKFADHIIRLRQTGWVDSLHYYAKFPIFYVRMQQGVGNLYYKYYPDTKEKVSEYLGKTINIRTDLLFDSREHFDAIAAQIPNY